MINKILHSYVMKQQLIMSVIKQYCHRGNTKKISNNVIVMVNVGKIFFPPTSVYHQSNLYSTLLESAGFLNKEKSEFVSRECSKLFSPAPT